MSSVVLVAVITPAPGTHDQVRAAVSEVVPRVHQEQGCELYTLHRDNHELVVIEKWASADDLAAHSAGQPLQELRQTLTELKCTIQVRRLDPWPLGTSGQGEL